MVCDAALKGVGDNEAMDLGRKEREREGRVERSTECGARGPVDDHSLSLGRGSCRGG